MTRNPHFLAEVAVYFRKDDEIIVVSIWFNFEILKRKLFGKFEL